MSQILIRDQISDSISSPISVYRKKRDDSLRNNQENEKNILIALEEYLMMMPAMTAFRDPVEAPLRKLSVDLIKTYKHINEVGTISYSLEIIV